MGDMRMRGRHTHTPGHVSPGAAGAARCLCPVLSARGPWGRARVEAILLGGDKGLLASAVSLCDVGRGAD